jgi:hypothetical protein
MRNVSVLLEEDRDYPLPKLYRVRQAFPRPQVRDIEKTIRLEMAASGVRSRVRPGCRAAVAVGSRGIANLSLIVKTVIRVLKEWGASPFVVSAMGSHGDGTEEGQRLVLQGYGITEEAMGVPIVTRVETEQLGTISKGRPVYFDREALHADLIVPINRVKLHTDFIGPLQSGLAKMLVIGLGNQKGCSAIHETPPEEFAAVIEEAARLILEKAPVGFGVAILENAYDETAELHVLPADHLIEQEKELVKTAIRSMPRLYLPKIDVLIMEQIGKDVSGAGFDPNIVGRSTARKEFLVPIPDIQRMVLLDISEASHGNGIGIGLFDVITRNIFPKLDLDAIYTNAAACKCIEDARIPLMAADEEEAVRVAVKACRGLDRSRLKIVRIKDTLHLGEIEVSEALLPEVEAHPQMEWRKDVPPREIGGETK